MINRYDALKQPILTLDLLIALVNMLTRFLLPYIFTSVNTPFSSKDLMKCYMFSPRMKC